MKAQSKYQYFHKGVDKQKTADITVDFRKPSSKTMDKWSEEERSGLAEFLEDVD